MRQSRVIITRHVAALCFLLIWATLCVAQKGNVSLQGTTTPNFSGRWTLDKSKSNVPGLAESLPSAEITMVIDIDGPEVHISKNMIVDGREHIGDWFYYTDGRGESNPPFPGSDSEFKTHSKWSSNKLISTASLDMNVAGQIIHVEAEETLELSRDGKTLVDTISKRNQKGVESIKLIYKRVR